MSLYSGEVSLLEWSLTVLLTAAYLWLLGHAAWLVRTSAGQERRCWVGLALLPPSALLLLAFHAWTPSTLWQEVMLDAQPASPRTGPEAWPLKMLLWTHVLVPIRLGLPLLKLPDLRPPGLAVIALPFPLWLLTVFLVWQR